MSIRSILERDPFSNKLKLKDTLQEVMIFTLDGPDCHYIAPTAEFWTPIILYAKVVISSIEHGDSLCGLQWANVVVPGSQLCSHLRLAPLVQNARHAKNKNKKRKGGVS